MKSIYKKLALFTILILISSCLASNEPDASAIPRPTETSVEPSTADRSAAPENSGMTDKTGTAENSGMTDKSGSAEKPGSTDKSDLKDKPVVTGESGAPEKPSAGDIPEDIRKRLGKAIIMYVGSTKAYVNNGNGKVTEENGSRFGPTLFNLEIMVPVDYVSGVFGIKCAYDGSTSAWTIKTGSKTAVFAPGSKKLNIDGEELLMNAPAQNMNGIVYLPLKSLAEDILGKSTFFDRNLIVISTWKDILNRNTDRNLINRLISLFDNFAGKSSAPADKLYDIAILNGTVVDPETRTVKFGYNVGIKQGKISVITDEDIAGMETVNAKGLVVSPGFIDVLSYDPNPVGNRFKIGDGVTTNLCMHGATIHFKNWFNNYSNKKMIVNYGGAVFHGMMRNELGIGRYSAPTKSQIGRMKAMTEQAIKEGAIGISFSMEYIPGTTPEEILAIMNVAKKYKLMSFFHVRYSDMDEPGTNIEAIKEVIGYARKTGCPVQIVHINSTGGTFSMARSLKIIDDARKEGLDITIDTYPYHYWATYANSARFDEGWQKRFKIDYSKLQVGGSSEVLTKESFSRYRKTGKLLVAYAIPEKDVELSLKPEYAMIGSDCIIEPSLNNHPRGAGCFSRTIGLYAREKNVISLMHALEMMTINPARRLENVAPSLKNKGRLQVGKDADIVVFDFNRISDTATVEKPASYSSGICYVMVNGVVVKDMKGFREGVNPGRPVKNAMESGSLPH